METEVTEQIEKAVQEQDLRLEATLNNLDALSSDEESESEELEQALREDDKKAEMSQADKEAAKQGALMAVGFLEQMVKSKLPMIEYSDSQRIQLSEKIAPVMGKYGAGLPDWLMPYKEEIELGVCLASFGFSTYLQYQGFLAQQRFEADKNNGGASGGDESQAS
tara:strand:+ start:1873 stop:2367 length:495 start_codon:yes stop_codon:yes gene_type:complete